jgi:hypothetical protein
MRTKLLTTAAVAVAALGFSAPAQAVELVANGGFETGDFTGWIQAGNTSFTNVTTGAAHSGTYGASMGPVGVSGSLSQLLNTSVAGNYTVSFWLQNLGGPQNSFSAFFDGLPLIFTLDDSGAFAYTSYTFSRSATTAPSLLSFEFRQDPSFWNLDDISVQGPEGSGVPEPSTWAMMLIGFGAVGYSIRRSRKPKAIAALA